MPDADLSVIIPTCRPQWLANVLGQLRRQSLGNLRTEAVVVAEGEPDHFAAVLAHYQPDRVIHKPVEGQWGSFARDAGIAAAMGEYLAFWDDDNLYHGHALATLYAAAYGVDVGIVACRHMAFNFAVLPRPGTEVAYCNVDTMCFAVRREVAQRHRWADHRDAGTDWAFLRRVLESGATWRQVPLVIGEKLERGAAG